MSVKFDHLSEKKIHLHRFEMDDAWRILLACDSFWTACMVRSSCMGIMMDLKSTCHLFRDTRPSRRSPKSMRSRCSGSPRAYASPFLTAFDIAYSRGLEECLQKRLLRTESVERKWAMIRAQKRQRWDAEFQANLSRGRRQD